ncbi:triose-phosphate isomerase [bacterium]|nr:triose-phosphate isomerase [bacterium]
MLIVANWKMYGSAAMIAEFARATPPYMPAVTRVVCPPSIWLAELRSKLAHTDIRLGGQDCHEKPEGAYTGDVAAAMLRELGAGYVIVGHSERRQYHGETDAVVAQKMQAAMQAGLNPIVCVGESRAQREDGRAWEVVKASLEALAAARPAKSFVIAYEPVWAIGTGLIPTLEDVADMHGRIAAYAKSAGLDVAVLYGGSVKPDNALGLAGVEHVDGFLIGGASLQAASFQAIAQISSEAAVPVPSPIS